MKKLTMSFPVVLALALSAAAQSDAVRSIYINSATIPTNVDWIHMYPAPPEGFNALTAADEELAAYGVPPRPDKVQDPAGYRRWTRTATVMSNPRSRWYGEIKLGKSHSGPAMAALSPKESSEPMFGASSAQGKGWSGVTNTLPLTKWSSTKSFKSVKGEFSVPVPQQAFSGGGNTICDGDIDQAAFWVGLGGLSVKGVITNTNVAQAGVDIYAACGVFDGSGGYAWTEWYPNPMAQFFNVNPGDDIAVNVTALSPTSVSVFVIDFTQQQTVSGLMAPPSGVSLIGNEAEYIVERPGGDSTPSGLYPLANYIWSFWDFARAETFNGAYYYPGTTAPSTIVISMTNDSGSEKISIPSIDAGLQNLFVQNGGCSYSGGCTP